MYAIGPLGPRLVEFPFPEIGDHGYFFQGGRTDGVHGYFLGSVIRIPVAPPVRLAEIECGVPMRPHLRYKWFRNA